MVDRPLSHPHAERCDSSHGPVLGNVTRGGEKDPSVSGSAEHGQVEPFSGRALPVSCKRRESIKLRLLKRYIRRGDISGEFLDRLGAEIAEATAGRDSNQASETW